MSLEAANVVLPNGGANSAPLNSLAGFEEAICRRGKDIGKRKKRRGAEGTEKHLQ